MTLDRHSCRMRATPAKKWDGQVREGLNKGEEKLWKRLRALVGGSMQLSSCKRGSRRTGLLPAASRPVRQSALGHACRKPVSVQMQQCLLVQVPVLTAPAGGLFRCRCSVAVMCQGTQEGRGEALGRIEGPRNNDAFPKMVGEDGGKWSSRFSR